MKKLLFFCAIALCCACTSVSIEDIDSASSIFPSDDILTKSSITSETRCKQDFNVNYETAKIAAERIFSSGKKLEEFYPFVAKGDTLFYVANYDKGYKIITADTRTSAILLESEDDRFSLENQDESFNAPLFWMDNLAGDIYALKEGVAETDESTNAEFWASIPIMMPRRDSVEFEDDEHVWVKILDYESSNTHDENTVNHLILTKWGQRYPWNVKVPYAGTGDDPHCPTGCSAVAVAQMLYFTRFELGKPAWLNHDAEITGISYDVDNFSINYTPGTYTEYSSRWYQMPTNQYGAHTDYVASLMADVGYVLEMEYTPNGSTSGLGVADFNHYGIYCTQSAFNTYNVNSNLLSGMPVVIAAYAIESTIIDIPNIRGHVWIIDGMKTRITEVVRGYVWRRLSDLDYPPTGLTLYSERQALEMEPNLYPGKRVTETSRAYSYYYRMNWGADGDYDNILYGAPGGGDDEWIVNGHDYCNNRTIFYDIH